MEETAFSRLTLCDDGILEAHPIQRDAPRTAKLLSDTLDALERVGAGGPRPVLWDPSGTLPLRPMGWSAIVDRVSGVIAAFGVVLDESEVQLLGGFPDAVNSLLIPFRVFGDASSAREWLRQFVDPSLPVG